MPTTRNGALSRNRMPLLRPLAIFWPSGELSKAVLHIAHWAGMTSGIMSKAATTPIGAVVVFVAFAALGWLFHGYFDQFTGVKHCSICGARLTHTGA